VEPLTLAELEARADELDRVALAAPEIDRFCSSSSWVLPAAEALAPGGASWVHAGAEGFFAAVRRRHGARRVIEPLEASWGLASALVGARPEPLVREVLELLRAREAEWDLLVLAGTPLDSSLLQAAARGLGGRYRLGLGPVTRRHVASLEGGLEGFLSRRARGRRKSVRQAERRAAELGIEFEEATARTAAEADTLFARVLAVERRSWKGRGGIGLDTEGFREFYQLMARRLASRGRLRCLLGRRGEEDVAYVLGAVFGHTYRGLQFSFDDRFREVGLGHLAQVRTVGALSAEPDVVRYDLGTGGEYKAAWAEQVVDSVVLVAGQ
jgi:hypothetical protein